MIYKSPLNPENFRRCLDCRIVYEKGTLYIPDPEKKRPELIGVKLEGTCFNHSKEDERVSAKNERIKVLERKYAVSQFFTIDPKTSGRVVNQHVINKKKKVSYEFEIALIDFAMKYGLDAANCIFLSPAFIHIDPLTIRTGEYASERITLISRTNQIISSWDKLKNSFPQVYSAKQIGMASRLAMITTASEREVEELGKRIASTVEGQIEKDVKNSKFGAGLDRNPNLVIYPVIDALGCHDKFSKDIADVVEECHIKAIQDLVAREKSRKTA